MDPRRKMQHFEKFCIEELGFRVEEIGNFAVHFGWEAAWVGPMHAIATATRNTYSQWLSIFYSLGRKEKFEEYLCSFKIDVRTILRSVKGGEKLVAVAVWSDAGDLVDAVTKGRIFPIKHPDTMDVDELREAYNQYLSDVTEEEQTHSKLIQAVAERDDIPKELFEILLQCEHLWSNLCKTVWSKHESWESYVERVRKYDPVGVTFKRIHYALLFGHGLDYNKTGVFASLSHIHTHSPIHSLTHFTFHLLVQNRNSINYDQLLHNKISFMDKEFRNVGCAMQACGWLM